MTQERLVVVTGAARGIGRSIAIGFGARGDTVVINHPGEPAAAGTTADFVSRSGGRAVVIEADVADPGAVAMMDEHIAGDEPAVMTCSALKRSYRDTLLGGRPGVRMVFLAPDREVLAKRLAARQGHFFSGQLLGTQLDALEPPQPDENVITVNPVGNPADTVTSIIAVLGPNKDGTAGGDHEAKA